MNGGAGNDTLVWNQGDGSDVADGDLGNDGAEVNGAPTLGDVLTLEASTRRVKLQRTNLGPFTFDAATERFEAWWSTTRAMAMPRAASTHCTRRVSLTPES